MTKSVSHKKQQQQQGTTNWKDVKLKQMIKSLIIDKN